MREHPWHIRRVTHRHLHEQRNLLDLHFLTHAWAQAGEAGTETQSSIENPFEREPTLEDDTTPEDVLSRLERAVRDVQSQTIRNMRKGGAAAAEGLAQASYNAGKECAQRRWPREESSPAAAARGPSPDKRPWLGALYHSPLAGRAGESAFLVRRALVSEVCVELRQCPHRRPESGDAADELCLQQFHWLRGYLSHLDPRLAPTLSRAGERCAVQW